MVSNKDLILKHALANALTHEGKANEGAVLGKVLAENPGLKKDIENLRKEIKKVVSEVTKLKSVAQEKKLREIWPEFFTQGKKEETRELPELKNAVKGKVVLRLPPEPNGFIHIGNAISFFFNYYYAQKYNGKLILRFEDTNPEAEELEFYTAIKEDIDWLGIKYDEMKNNSDDMETFYSAAEKLVKKGAAYICTCDVETMRKNRFGGKACVHREYDCKENLDLWEHMFNEFKEGQAVLRLKSDLSSENTVMRDPTLFRIVEHAHPIQKNKYRVWPLYDFANAVEDAICGVTHVLRSAEFMQRDELQNKIRELLEYKNPEIISYSRINFAGSPTSKRKLLDLMNRKIISSWDDPRLVTIRALRGRGFLPEAIYKMALNVRMTLSSTTIDWDMLAAENRKLLDKNANRYFFVPDPIKVEVKNAPTRVIFVKLHPNFPERGERKQKVLGTFFVPREDVEKMASGDVFRFKDAYNVKIDAKDSAVVRATFSGKDVIENTPKIQWVTPTNIPAEIRIPGVLLDKDENPLLDSMKVVKGFCEEDCKNIKPGEAVQFERFGFVKIEKIGAEKIEGILTHK
ncbi:TPA: glutamate--tRNA ligase [archaeon]|uniref:Glutamate--tRNA ligase n=1 Tax=Candidatus Naiadarchaeum limnaeum TaxID=2756139 RepID=A0A832XGV1_9ARCH|nr:glutamate--tRNA ligase [Candidatus Naiadarchaeales archaeon SRR2090153.bin1042]HIK00609.1 glutamate--tRNA ligase [Candidatus Naiadarchaeum limnaeum]